MTGGSPSFLALSIYPFSRGFAFVLFEGDASPFDWGIKEIKEKHKNTKAFDAITSIVARYQPDVLLIEDTSHPEARRSSRIRKLYRMICHLAASEAIDVQRYSKSDVRNCFASTGAESKQEIARAIAAQIPAFALRMPPLRRAWMSEDPRMSLFHAAALGLTFFAKGIGGLQDGAEDPKAPS